MCQLLIGGTALYTEIGGSAGSNYFLVGNGVVISVEIGGSDSLLCVHYIYMSSYFRDHTRRLVRIDPLRNLPPGYLTPSLTRLSPIDLPRFPLVVDLGPIPMANINDGNNENL